VLSADALGQVVMPALGAPLDDVAVAEHVLLTVSMRSPVLVRISSRV
jgi:hypothetical protein